MVHKQGNKVTCPEGKLKVHRAGFHRKGYKREDGTYVDPAYVPPTTYCIEDIGAKGRGKERIKIKRKGALKQYGYDIDASTRTRRKALRKAMKKYGKPSVFKMLQAQVIFRKGATGERAENRKIFEKDRNWVEDQMTSRQKRKMIGKARKEWMKMSPKERAKAMPNG